VAEIGRESYSRRPKNKETVGMIDLYTWNTPNGHNISTMLNHQL
jgi:hypothetical protein